MLVLLMPSMLLAALLLLLHTHRCSCTNVATSAETVVVSAGTAAVSADTIAIPAEAVATSGETAAATRCNRSLFQVQSRGGAVQFFRAHIAEIGVRRTAKTATSSADAAAACDAVTVVYGFLMVAAGARFVGPLGISLMWCIYHALSPWLLLWYSILPFEHEIDKQHSRWKYLFGRNAFDILCHVAFVATWACFFIAYVLAWLTKSQADKDGFGVGAVYTNANLGPASTNTVFHFTPAHTFSCLKGGCAAPARPP